MMKTRAVFVVAFVIASINGDAYAWAFGWSFRHVYTDYHLEYRTGRPSLSGFTIGYDKGSIGCTGINYLGYGLSYARNHELTQWSAFASCYRFGFASVQFSKQNQLLGFVSAKGSYYHYMAEQKGGFDLVPQVGITSIHGLSNIFAWRTRFTFGYSVLSSRYRGWERLTFRIGVGVGFNPFQYARRHYMRHREQHENE